MFNVCMSFEQHSKHLFKKFACCFNISGLSYLKNCLGNLIILSPDEDDVGLYQCGASNSEGVAFSRVIRVASKFFRKLENSSPQRVGGGGRALNGPSELFLVMPTSNGKFEPEHIQIVESEIAEEK